MPVSCGPYRLLELLAHGAQSVLYLAEHSVTHVQVVLKRAETSHPQQMAAFFREIAFLKRLQHPGIVQLFEDGVEQYKPWFTLERLQGPSLLHSISPPLPQAPSPVWSEEALHRHLILFLRLAESLLYLEQAGIVHRDLKPDNILLRTPEQPVLIDFGTAIRTAHPSGREVLEMRREVVGSYPFMPPEQLLGGLSDTRSDLYSLGATMYRVLTGVEPFVSLHQVLDPNLRLTPPSQRVSGVPRALDELLLRLLAKDPSERTQSAGALIEELSSLLTPSPRDIPTSQPLRQLNRPQLAGRHPELQALVQQVESTLEHARSSLLCIEGESGIGKTRLVQEAVEKLRTRHPRLKCLLGECPPPASAEQQETSSHPLAAFRDLFQAIVEHCLAGGPAETERVLGRRGVLLQRFHPSFQVLRGQEKGEPTPYALPEEALHHLVTTVRATLSALAPVLIVLDDLQWADALSLELLARLLQAPAPKQPSLIFLAIVRTHEPSTDASPLSVLPYTWRIKLSPLEADAMRELVQTMLDDAKTATTVSMLLKPLVGGNPFFGAECVRAWVAEKRLQPTVEGRWQLTSPVQSGVFNSLTPPHTVRMMLLQRLSLLPAPCQRLLEAACLLAPRFSESTLAECLQQPAEVFADALQTALLHQFLVQDGTHLYHFCHDLIRQTLQQGLTSEQRMQLHRRLAQALESLYPAPDHDQRIRLAHHWEQGGASERALPLYRQIMLTCMEHHMLDATQQAALAYLRLATEASGERSAVWRALGERVYVARGAFAAALDAFTRAEQDAHGVGDRLLEGLAQASRAELLTWQCRFDEAQSLMDTITMQLHAQGDRLAEAQMHLRFGAVLTQCWRQKEAEGAYLAAAELFAAEKDFRGELMALSGLAHGAALLPPSQADALLSRSIALSHVLQDPGAEAEVQWRYAASFSLRDDWGHLPLLDQAVEGLMAAGEQRWTIIALTWLVRGRILCGPGASLIELTDRIQQLLETTETPLHRAMLLSSRGQLFWHEGQLEQASQRLEEGIQLLEALHDRLMRAHLLHDLGQVRAEQGREEEARALLEQSTAHHLPHWPGLFMHLLGLVHMIQLERRAGNLARAAELLKQAWALCLEHDAQPLRVYCLCELGHLALAQGASGQELLSSLQALLTRVSVASGGEVSRAVTRFTQATRAHGEGAPLWQGERLLDLPRAVLQAVQRRAYS